MWLQGRPCVTQQTYRGVVALRVCHVRNPKLAPSNKEHLPTGRLQNPVQFPGKA